MNTDMQHVNHSDGEKSFGYVQDAYNSEQMLEILSGLFDEFMDLYFSRSEISRMFSLQWLRVAEGKWVF